MMRVDGTLRTTTWDACLDDLGTQLRETIDDSTDPSPSASSSAPASAWTRSATASPQALHAAIGTPAKFSPLTIDGTAKVLMAELMGGSSALDRPPRLRQRHVRRCSSAAIPLSPTAIRSALPESGHARSATSRSTPRSGSSTPATPRRPGSPPTTSRRGRAPTTRCSPSWCASCCATAPTATCSSARTSTRLAAAVEPFTLRARAAVADVPEAELNSC